VKHSLFYLRVFCFLVTLSYFFLSPLFFTGGLFFFPCSFFPRQTWVVDLLSTCLPPPSIETFFIAAHLLHPRTTQNYDPKSAFSFFLPPPPPLAGYQSGTATDSITGTKAQRAQLFPLGLQLHLLPTTHRPPEKTFPFLLPPRWRPGPTPDAPPPDRSHVYPPNFPPFSDGDIAIWKIPPRTLRSLTDPDYAQLPAIALAIGRSVFRGCDYLKPGWATRKRVCERARKREDRVHTTSDQCPERGPKGIVIRILYEGTLKPEVYAGAI
jgi:hypothetical protein